VESVVVTLIGGIVGYLIGVFCLFCGGIGHQKLGYNWPFVVTFSSIVLAVGISFLVGIFFGIYPARKAAKLNLVEALAL